MVTREKTCGDYICWCLECGGKLYVTYVNASIHMHAELTQDGFEFENIKQADTEDEVVKCIKCGTTYKLSELMTDK